VAVVGFVKPEAVLHDHGSDRDRAAFTRLPGRPLADCRLGVALDDTGTVGVGAVDEKLHLGIAKRQVAGEIGPDADDAVHLSGEHEFPCLGHGGEKTRVEIR